MSSISQTNQFNKIKNERNLYDNRLKNREFEIKETKLITIPNHQISKVKAQHQITAVTTLELK